MLLVDLEHVNFVDYFLIFNIWYTGGYLYFEYRDYFWGNYTQILGTVYGIIIGFSKRTGLGSLKITDSVLLV